MNDFWTAFSITSAIQNSDKRVTHACYAHAASRRQTFLRNFRPFCWDYDTAEIAADAAVHACGIVVGLLGAALLVAIAGRRGLHLECLRVAVYVVGLFTMFGLSAAYNLWPISPTKWILRRLDQGSIPIFIAATYTAFRPAPTTGISGSVMLAFIWSAALAGAARKII